MKIQNQTSIERLGHYRVGQKIYTLKSLALTDSINFGKPLQFIFNDDIFNRYDWTQEPEPAVGIREFYRRRAQQLRNNYDYIVLQYSGGPDSQTVFDTFMQNNILLDEVVNFNSYNKTQRVAGTAHNADYVYNVKPALDSMIKKHGIKQTRITIIDEIDMTKTIWHEYQNRDYNELLFTSGSFPSVWMMRGTWVKHVPHIWNRIQAGQRVCVVLGADKTHLRVENNKYCTKFTDVLCCDAASLIENDPDLKGHNVLEMFYHTPDYPELVIKQAHLLKNFVESQQDSTNFENTAYYSQTNHRPAFHCNSKQHPGNLRYQSYHDIVYPGHRPNIITPKPAYFGTRVMDCWWVHDMDSQDNRVWRQGFVKHYQQFRDFIRRDQQEFSSIQLNHSKTYFLEK